MRDVQITYGRKVVNPDTGEACELTDTVGFSGEVSETEFKSLTQTVKENINKDIQEIQQGWQSRSSKLNR